MELCRCCHYKTSIESSKNLLMESFNNIKFVDILNKIANINISENDKFSKSICNHCYEILLFISDFITLVRRTDNKFHRDINDETMDINSTVDTNQSEINETSNGVEEIASEVDVVDDFYDVQNDKSNNEQDASENTIVIDDDDDDDGDNSRISKNKSEDLYKNSNRSNELKKRHNCPICNKYFHIPYKVKRHMVVHTKSIKCHVCHEICFGVETFKEHVKMHNESRLKCIKCSSIYKHKRGLKKHLTSVHKLAMCNICCKTFEPNQIDAHLLNHPEQKVFICKVCPYSIDNEGYFKNHLTEHYENGVFGCQLCGKRFSRMYSLNRHLQTVHKSSTE